MPDCRCSNLAVSDEVESINSIYGPGTIQLLSANDVTLLATLRIPENGNTFSFEFPCEYPDRPPELKGVVSTTGAKGEGKVAGKILSEVLQRVWHRGQVCLFDLIEESRVILETESSDADGESNTKSQTSTVPDEDIASCCKARRPHSSPMYAALIRTHHITSRKKVATLKAAAKKIGCAALLRSGGSPGVMYVEARQEENVRKWVNMVHDLHYKDYQLVSPPVLLRERGDNCPESFDFEEVSTVKEFGLKMKDKGILDWWRKAMGYITDD